MLMKQFFYFKKAKLLLAAVLALFVGAGTSPAWAQKALPYSYGFEDYNLDTDGWTKYFGTSLSNNNNGCGIYGEAKKTGNYGFRFSSYSTQGANAQYLISPELNAPDGVIVSFAYKVKNGNYHESFKVGYSTTDTDVASFTWDEGTTSNSTSFTTYENTFPAGTKYVAIYYYSNYCYYLYVDDFSFTAPANGPALLVKDLDTKQTLTSPANYNFGPTTAGTIHYFLLNNPGTQDLGVTVSETGNFGATLSTTTVPAGGASNVALTVTMPDASSSSEITITPEAGSGIDPFVINVSGTIRDASKVYLDFSDGQIPDGWTSVAIGSYASSYGSEWTASTGYVGQSGSSSSYEWAFTSPKLTFANGETIFFETQKYSSSTWYTPSIKVEYSLDNSTWTTIGSAFTDDAYDTWTSRSVTIPVDGVKYIRFSGWYIKLRNIYGGEEANEPNMKVTQPTTLNFGVITEATQKTFTIANTGKATLEGINVTSSNAAFTISNAPTSLAAGASQEVTITMDATTTGALSSDITVSATGMTDVVFTVTGAVLPDGMLVVDFNDNQLPAGWTNASWTFANGEATGKSSSAYLTTPTLQFSDGDMLVIKLRNYDSDNINYITVQGSTDNGATWTGYNNKIMSSSFHSNTEWTTIVLSDIPSAVNKLRFVGYYVVVDEIAGLTYAPVLSVTLGGMDVTTPANLNFGECAADASATYIFANTGAGTIDITNVAITGDGVAAYSTNWTASTATPFDLVITRSYDATRTGAQDAAVTVTTSVGDFVINVTGTDKAANAPELAISTNAIDFGGVTADAVETVTVTNNGTGSMTVDIVSDSEDFVVSTAQLTEIGAGESKTFTVTFKFGTPYGAKSGNVTVTPTYDATAAQTITLTGKAKDPDVWSEDFSGNALPTGWDAGANWSFANGVAKAAYAYGSTTYLTTPTLMVSDATDELTFDYAATANYVSIKIQMSQNGGAFADYQTISGLNNGDAGSYTITGLEPGDYQFRFANDDYDLDNFEGFKLNMADHIVIISASHIPASPDWNVTMKEGQSFEATVTLKESRGVDEAVTAKFYMGTEVIGTQTGTVNAASTETLIITCTPTTSAPSGVAMHIEVEYAGGVLSTEEVTRYVAAITYLTLDETSSDALVSGTYDNVTLKRQFIEDWNTVCLPFTISDVEAFFGAGAKAYEFASYADDGTLGFSKVTTLTASYPYIVYVPAAITDDIALTNITIDAAAWYSKKNDAYFRGTYAPIAAGDLTGKYVLTTAAKIQKASSNATMNGFRAYFEIPSGLSVKALLFDDGTATSIVTIDNGQLTMDNVDVYNLAGQKLNQVRKGVNIVNGKKILVK